MRGGMVLAGSWLVLVVILPTLVSLLATTLYPAPSRMELTIAMRDAQTAAEKQRMKALDQYYHDHLELVPDAQNKARDFLTLAMANSAAIEKARRPLYERFLTTADYEQFPRFSYVAEPFAAALLRMAPSLLGLGLLVAGLAVLAFVDLRRYQVAAR